MLNPFYKYMHKLQYSLEFCKFAILERAYNFVGFLHFCIKRLGNLQKFYSHLIK